MTTCAAKSVHFVVDVKCNIFDISMLFFLPHPLPPLPRGERGGSTPHPAVHVRERRDHSPRGEWYRTGRTLWQVLEKLRADALPCYKEFASLMLFLNSCPLPPSHMGGGSRIYSFSSFEGAAATDHRSVETKRAGKPLGFSAPFRSRAKRAGCARGGAYAVR